MSATAADRYTVELADGNTLHVDVCPVTGDPIVDARFLPAGILSPFSSENPPPVPPKHQQKATVSLRCG